MRVGYASINIGNEDMAFRSLILKNATEDNLTEIISSNLKALNNIFDYNMENDIKLFRISSDLIPFASHPDVDFNWGETFDQELRSLGEKAKSAGMRLSMHPGQYTVLNSPKQDVVERAIDDLKYHCEMLDRMNMGPDCKIILHVGGAYGDKQTAMKRFKENYLKLDENIKQRLVIENDDRIFTIAEVLAIGEDIGIPVVFDNLHNEINPSRAMINTGSKEIKSNLGEVNLNYNDTNSSRIDQSKRENPLDQYAWIDECRSTWGPHDGPQKIHYSQQAPNRKTGSHSTTIAVSPFIEFVDGLPDKGIDVMLEVKDKNLSAKKCILCLDGRVDSQKKGEIRNLEEEWARYKYFVMERSQSTYDRIRTLLKDKDQYPAIEFYTEIEAAINQWQENGFKRNNVANTAQHVWGYFKKLSTPKELERFKSFLHKIREGEGSEDHASARGIKRFLHKLAIKYEVQYLIDSYYFLEIY